MLPLLFCEMGATPAAGHNWSITMTQASATTWKATAWFGGTNLGSYTMTRQLDAGQRALALAASSWVDTFYGATDPNN